MPKEPEYMNEYWAEQGFANPMWHMRQGDYAAERMSRRHGAKPSLRLPEDNIPPPTRSQQLWSLVLEIFLLLGLVGAVVATLWYFGYFK